MRPAVGLVGGEKEPMNWLDYLEEAVKDGFKLNVTRQRRGYTLFFAGKSRHDSGEFVVRQGATGVGGDKRSFADFKMAYDWLLNGTPVKSTKP